MDAAGFRLVDYEWCSGQINEKKHAISWEAVEQASIPGTKAYQAITPFAFFNQGHQTRSVRMSRHSSF